MSATGIKIAALYVEEGGVYYGLPDVDPWPESRDARLYAGPWPVVAHPPCNRWAKLGPIERRGQDDGCFEAALRCVRSFGGVLEHPAETRAWKAYGLPRPGRWWTRTLTDDGWVIATDQSLYGFPTRKPTWLYYVGPDPRPLPLSPVTATRGCDALWSTERAKTPAVFRDVLLSLAAGRTATGEDTGAVEGTGGYREPEAPGKNAAPSERGSSSAPHVPSSAAASATGEGEA